EPLCEPIALRRRGSPGLATTGPRSCGLAAPQTSGVASSAPPGCEVSRTWRGIRGLLLNKGTLPQSKRLATGPAARNPPAFPSRPAAHASVIRQERIPRGVAYYHRVALHSGGGMTATAARLDPHKFQDPFVTAAGERRARVALGSLDTLWFNTGTLCNLTCHHCSIES